MQDRFAEGLLLTLIEEGPKALAEPEDYAVRANIMWTATLALNGLIGAGVPQDWATHMLGHEITALHGLDHAQTLAIILPGDAEVQRGQSARSCCNTPSGLGPAPAAARTRASTPPSPKPATSSIAGRANHLRDYGIGAEAVPAAARQLERHGMTALGEHQDIDLATSRRILELSVAA